MTKKNRSNPAPSVTGEPPVVLGPDDLTVVEGGNHFAGCTKPVVVRPLCPPPPPPC